MKRLPILLAALLALLTFSACRRDPKAGLREDPSVLALAGRFRIEVRDLEKALAGRQGEPSANALLASRVLDGLVEEALILTDALPGPPPRVPQPLWDFGSIEQREAAVSMALRQRVYGKVSVTPGDVAAYYAAHAHEFKKGPGVLLREILLPGEAQVREAKALLARGHSFVDVARLYSLSPERGATQYFEFQELPDYLRTPLAQARPGVPTGPIQASSEYFQIFLVEKRYDSYTPTLDELAPQIRLTLADERGDRLYREYLADLRRRFPPEVFWAKLPFAYEKETP
ncbi:MAG: peptidylprolyl isomerase [Acidobacteriota bacterium]